MILMEFSSNGTSFIVAAKDKNSAIVFMADIEGTTRYDIIDHYAICEVPREQWSQIKVHDIEETDPFGNPCVLGTIEDAIYNLNALPELICIAREE